MTNEEQKGIQEIQGTLGYRAIQSLLDDCIEGLKDVTGIDIDKPNIEAKTVGRILAVKWCKEIKDQINLTSGSEKNPRRTYE